LDTRTVVLSVPVAVIERICLQTEVLLRHALSLGGQATMTDFFQALSRATPTELRSFGGRPGLRHLVSRILVAKGLLRANLRTMKWLLTPKGRALVTPTKRRTSRSKTSSGNATSKWLDKHLKPAKGETESELYSKLKSALSWKLPVSASSGMIEDHVQNFLLRAIRRDSFAHLLEDGKDLPYAKVCAYCVNSGRTDARDMSTEPVCRELYGARTEKERKEYRPYNGVVQGERVLDSDGNFISPENVTVIDETASDFETIWSQIENVVHDHKPNAWERYSGILAMRAYGLNPSEIAQAEGVSRNRAASMLAEARRCVRSSYAAGHLEGYLA